MQQPLKNDEYGVVHQGEGASENTEPRWSPEDGSELYQVAGWGDPYFSINDRGHVQVTPDPSLEHGVDLYDLTVDLEARGLPLPLLLRFSNILEHRMDHINRAFQRAIDEYEYPGVYRGVYPVKVNQQRHLVEEVVAHGKPWGFGLEAGSKPELLIALASMGDSEGLIICNGYKDLEYLETALIAHRFNKTVIIVLERAEELALVLQASETLGIEPVLGVRSKLGTRGMGRWADSAGDRAKFGLSAAEIMWVVEDLQRRNMLNTLQLLHFHIGSQVSSILPLKNALREAARFYVELVKLGAHMKYLDVGGGLAVDYDGSRTDFHASKNYDIQEYAYDVVASVQEACESSNVSAPTIVSESGRAMAAHQSVLVFEVLGSNEMEYEDPEEPTGDAHAVIRELYETWKHVQPKNVQEAWHDAVQAKEEAQSLFRFGYFSLRDRARAERLFWHCGRRILSQAKRLKHVPEEIEDIEQVMSAIYYCNFSLFQSAPDTWAIDQLFPVMPIHRLDEKPTSQARLADLTCDSDGMIDNFIDREEPKHALPVHRLKVGERYYMAMFLMGAYQEILGDLHNLFGDTHAVHVRMTETGYQVAHVVKGDSMDNVLRYVQYDPDIMTERVRSQAEDAYQAGRITLPQMKLLMDLYERSLRGYTYLAPQELG